MQELLARHGVQYRVPTLLLDHVEQPTIRAGGDRAVLLASREPIRQLDRVRAKYPDSAARNDCVER